MSWRNVRLIFHREVRDQMRDRRTLFMVAVLPLLLYPALGIGMMQMTVLFTEQSRTVVILGSEHLPDHPPLIVGDQIAAGWFENPSDAEKLQVIVDKPRTPDEAEAQTLHDAELLEQASRFRMPVRKRHKIKEGIARAERDLQRAIGVREAIEEGEDISRKELQEKQIEELHAKISELSKQLVPIEHEIANLFSESEMQVLIVVPDGFAENIARVNSILKDRKDASADEEYFFGPTPITNRANEKSLIAYNRVREALRNWEKKILAQRLDEAALPANIAAPVNPDTVDVAQKDEIAANLWSKLFPALLVIMAVTGAFYPAVDVAAGEKERGTMETLLICPASRSEIVLGKFLTVLLFSLSTAVLNLSSMGLTGQYMVGLAGGAASGPMAAATNIAFPPVSSLFWLVILSIPLAALFSALCLALATFARSSKEGQYYLTPLLMVTLGVTVFCLSPAIEINPFYSVMPVAGVALLLKGLLLSPDDAMLYYYLIPVLLTSVGYSLLALWWAIEQFQNENVLFREAERFEVGLWLRHLMRDKEPTPSFAEAGFCFVLVMLLQFLALKPMRDSLMANPTAEWMLQLQMVNLIATIACPALFMGVMLTTDVRRTFQLRMPKWGALTVAVWLPLALHPLSVELLGALQWFFPQLPPEVTKVFSSLSDKDLSVWYILLAFAVVPALCEEVTFRGFILSGFMRSKRPWLAIVLSSMTFGIVHMIPQQVFNASLLGLVLGLLVFRGRSLFLGIIFHFIYNSLQVARMRVDTSWIADSQWEWMFFLEGGIIRYRWPTLVLSAFVAIALLRWFVRQPLESISATASQHHLDSSTKSITESGLMKKPSVGV